MCLYELSCGRCQPSVRTAAVVKARLCVDDVLHTDTAVMIPGKLPLQQVFQRGSKLLCQTLPCEAFAPSGSLPVLTAFRHQLDNFPVPRTYLRAIYHLSLVIQNSFSNICSSGIRAAEKRLYNSRALIAKAHDKRNLRDNLRFSPFHHCHHMSPPAGRHQRASVLIQDVDVFCFHDATLLSGGQDISE